MLFIVSADDFQKRKYVMVAKLVLDMLFIVSADDFQKRKYLSTSSATVTLCLLYFLFWKSSAETINSILYLKQIQQVQPP